MIAKPGRGVLQHVDNPGPLSLPTRRYADEQLGDSYRLLGLLLATSTCLVCAIAAACSGKVAGYVGNAERAVPEVNCAQGAPARNADGFPPDDCGGSPNDGCTEWVWLEDVARCPGTDFSVQAPTSSQLEVEGGLEVADPYELQAPLEGAEDLWCCECLKRGPADAAEATPGSADALEVFDLTEDGGDEETDVGCTAQCQGLECGPGACGGSCGVCGQAELCVGGSCMPAACSLTAVSGLAGSANGIAFSDGMAFVNAGFGGVQVLDVSAAGELTLLGAVPNITLPSGFVLSVTAGSNLVVAGVVDVTKAPDEFSVQIFSVSGSGLPTMVGEEKPLAGLPSALSLDWPYLYVAASWKGFAIYDISDPTMPALIAEDLKFESAFMHLQDGLLYLCNDDFDGSIIIMDATDPYSPALIADIETPSCLGLVASNGFLYVLGGSAGLLLFSLSPGQGAEYVAAFPSFGFNSAIDAQDDRAWLSGGAPARLLEVDLSVPQAPALASITIAGGQSGRDVTVEGTRAYVAAESVVETWDVAVPGSPVLLDQYPLPGFVRGLAMENDAVYVLGRGSMCRAEYSAGGGYEIDGHLLVPDRLLHDPIVAVDSRVYVGDETLPGVIAVDWTNAEEPSVEMEIEAGEVRGLAVVDFLLLAALASGDLKIYDVKEPSAPDLTGDLVLPGALTGFAASVVTLGSMAFIGSTDAFGIFLVDVSTPSSPKLLSTFETPGQPVSMSMGSDGTLLVAGGWAGLLVLKWNGAELQVVSSYSIPGGIGLGVAAVAGGAVLTTRVDSDLGIEVVGLGNPASPVGKASLFLMDDWALSEEDASFRPLVHDDRILVPGLNRGMLAVDAPNCW